MQNPENIEVNGKLFSIKKLLGKGKGGYSYLAEKDGKKYTLKQIHHEPCDYFQFGNKIEAEARDYKRLVEAGVNVPKLYEIDFEKECYLNETIALESYSDSNDYYVVGRKNDGILSFIVKFSSKENF